MSWLTTKGFDPIITETNGEIKFLSELDNLPVGFTETKLGLLSAQLRDQIEAGGPDQRTITILGTEVPGRLLVLAAPLVLAGLAYYFKSHLSHLKELAGKQSGEMYGFAWLPINQAKWEVPFTKGTVLLHKAELIATVAILPISALIIMLYKLSSFGTVSVGIVFIALATCVFSACVAAAALKDI